MTVPYTEHRLTPEPSAVLFLGMQAIEFQKIGQQIVGVLREAHLAWPERILAPLQYVRGIVTASPWIVNTVALSREVGEGW